MKKNYGKFLLFTAIAITGALAFHGSAKADINNNTGQKITSSTIASSGAATVAGNNIFTGSNIFGSTSTFTGDAYLGGSSSTIYASPNGWVLAGDVGTYYNNLCNRYAPNSNSSVNIMMPVQSPASSSWQVPIILTQRCNFIGVGIGTHLTWGGAQGTTATAYNFGSTPHYRSGGFQNFWLDNSGSATTTNATIGLLIEATHSLTQGMTISNFGVGISGGNNAYDVWINQNSIHDNGQNFLVQEDLFSNAGEGWHVTQNWIVDAAFNNPVGCAVFSGLESLIYQGNITDDCQLVLGATGSGAILSGAVNGGDSENAAASTNVNYPSYPMITIASNTQSNINISAYTFFNDASSTTSTASNFIHNGANLSFSSIAAGKNFGRGAATLTNFILADGNSHTNGCMPTGNSATGGAYNNLINGDSIFAGCIDWLTGTQVGTGYISVNNTVGGVAAMRVDANAGLAEYTFGNNLSTEWIIADDATNSDRLVFATSTANVTSSPIVSFSRSTGGSIWRSYMGYSTSSLITITSCGTAPTGTVIGSNQGGTITVGGTATGCTLTFSPNWASAPVCHVTNQSMSITSALGYTETTSTLVITQATGLSGDKVDYTCQGNPN